MSEELKQYCNNIIKYAPKDTLAYKIAELGLFFLDKNISMEEIKKTCHSMSELSNIEQTQNKLAKLILSNLNDNNAVVIPKGYKILPVEPTERMLRSVVPGMASMKINRDEYDVNCLNSQNAVWLYKRMVSSVENK